MNNYYSLEGGIYIPENTNLDNYKIPGNYYCDSSSLVSSITNCPSSSAFTMKIEYSVGNSYPAQIVREYNTGNIFYRYFTTTQNKWIAWVKVVTNADLTSRLMPIVINGYLGDTFKNSLKDKANNSVNFIVFTSNKEHPIIDNPFSFTLGYSIVFHAGILNSPNILIVIGVSGDIQPIVEAKRIDLR